MFTIDKENYFQLTTKELRVDENNNLLLTIVCDGKEGELFIPADTFVKAWRKMKGSMK